MDSRRTVSLDEVAGHLDTLLRVAEVPDYGGAHNGVQVENSSPIRRVAVAVDASLETIQATIDAGANLLIVHHGLFWSGVQPLRGRIYERFHRLLTHDVAVYSAHIPLDLHPAVGNNVLLAVELDLEPTDGFGRYQNTLIGVMGASDLETAEVVQRVTRHSHREGGSVVTVGDAPGRRTLCWAICSGAGVTSDTLSEAVAAGVDTLIVGEGSHHTGVEARELGVAVIYAGHYATETLGVRALGAELEREFGLPWSFLAAPTGI